MPDERPLTDADVVAPLPETEGEPGPGEGAPAPARVKIAGKEFEVDPELAQALQEREGDFARKLSQQGEELGQLRTTVGNLMASVSAPKVEPEKPEFDWAKYEQLRYESPTEADKMFVEHLRGSEDRLRGEYQADQRRREAAAAWRRRLDQFYKANPDLDGEDDLVDTTYRRLLTTDPALRDAANKGDFDAVFEKVADETRRRILKYSQRKDGLKPTSQGGRMAVVEGGSPTRTGSRGGEDEEEDVSPKSLSEAIRRKQSRTRRGSNTVMPGRKRRSSTVV